MLKRNLKIITLLTIIVMLLNITFSFAENETDDATTTAVEETTTELTSDAEPTSEEPATENATTEGEVTTEATSQEDSLKKQDVYLMGEDVTIDYIVDGNLFVIANSVTINSQIGGDAFIIAKNITVTNQGYIFSNLFALANKVDVNGVIYDLYSAAEEINISGYVYRDIKVGTNALKILGTIGRNAFVSSSNVSFQEVSVDGETGENVYSSQGTISGDLNYYSNEEIEIPEGTVSGQVNYSKVTTNEKNKSTAEIIASYLYKLIGLICTTIIVWLLCLWLTPKFLQKTGELLTTKSLPIVGFGILTPIVYSIALIILFVIGWAINVSLSLLALLFIILLLSTPITIIALNNIICDKFKDKIKTETKIQKVIVLAAVTIVYWLITLIPIVGSCVSLLAVIIGIGIIVYNFVLNNITSKRKKDTKQQSNEKK